ncbi:uncharacterized protein LOC135501273 [Lineus longissimus]|uniref:uncharacterized protein LOC135501273 n=1 Tax=Lineus longissimus TaxID=88925 RepID=UPI002B4EABCC
MGNSKSREPTGVVDPAEIKLKSVFEAFTTDQTEEPLERRELPLTAFATCFAAGGTEYGTTFADSIRPYIPSHEQIPVNPFVHLGKQVMGMSSPAERLEYFWRVFAGGGAELSKDELTKMLITCYRLSIHSSGFGEQIEEFGRCDEIVKSIVESVWPKESYKIDKSLFFAWCQKNTSFIFSGTHSWTNGIWSQLDFRSQCAKCPSHAIIEDIKTGSYLLSVQYLWMLSCNLPHAYRQSAGVSEVISPMEANSWNKLSEILHWTNLYSSYLQGMSLNTLNFHIFSYKEPTIMLLKLEQGHLYCIGVDEEWKVGSQRWGGHSCIVIQLLPQLRIVQTGANMLFYNTETRGLPKGIQFGKDTKSVMLEIDEDMTTVKHYGVPLQLKVCEVWACGSPAARNAQMQQQQWEKKEVEKHKNRKLKVEDWKDNPDRQLLNMGGVNVDHQETDRG